MLRVEEAKAGVKMLQSKDRKDRAKIGIKLRDGQDAFLFSSVFVQSTMQEKKYVSRGLKLHNLRAPPNIVHIKSRSFLGKKQRLLFHINPSNNANWQSQASTAPWIMCAPGLGLSCLLSRGNGSKAENIILCSSGIIFTLVEDQVPGLLALIHTLPLRKPLQC